MRESKNIGYHSKSDRKVRRSGSSQSIRRRRRRLLVEGLESRVLLAGDLTITKLEDLLPYYDSQSNKYSYDAGHPAGAKSRVTFAADIITSAASISIEADEIFVDPGFTIDTSNATGQAGNISFAAHTKVYLSDQTKLLANGIDDAKDGSITISASHDMQTRAYVTAINMVENLINAFTSPAEITILSGVTIDGGDITIQTENGNHKMAYGSAELDQFKKLWKVYAAASPVPSSILSLPVTFQDWRPKARITINQASDETNTTNTTKILGSSSVTIGADAHASAVGKAVSASIPQMMFNQSGNNPNGWFGQKYLKTAWSAGLFLTDPEATVDIVNTIVSSSGDISISSDVENTISLTAKSTLNTGAGKTNPAGKAISFAYSEQSSTSTVYVDRNSLISSQGGVSITADANNSSSTTSSSAVYRDGTIGVAPAIADNHTDVKVTIDGKVTAIRSLDSSIPSPKPSYNSTFNPTFSVDIPTSTVTLSGIPLYKTGDAIALFSEEGGTLPGLAAGLYYVIVTTNSDNTYSLQFASSYENAIALKHISFGDAYPTLTNLRTNLAIPVTQTATDTQQQSLILFGDANGPDGATPLFEDGDTVQFTSAAKRFLGYIPTSGQLVELDQTASYRVKIVESKSKTYPLSIQLLDEANNPLNLFGGSYLESESGVRYPIGSIDLDQGQIDLRTRTLDSTGENITYTSPATPVSNGQKLVFHAGLSAESETLQDGDSFWAIVDPNESGMIRLALSAEQAEAANPAVQDALAHLTATFKGLQIPLTPDGKPSGLQAGQSFSIQTNGSTKTFVLTTDGVLGSGWHDGTVAVKLATDSAQEQADEIISAISQANIGLKASYQGSGKIAIGTQSDLLITVSSSVLQAADIPVDIPIGNFEAGVGLVFLDDPNLVDNLPVVYHAVPGKPMRGLVDGRVYHVYNVPNTNYNPVVPQYILTLMDGLEVSNNADSGSFELKITAPNGTSATTVPLAWNISAEDLKSQINILGLPDLDVRISGIGTVANPWFIDGVNLDAVALQNSSLSLNGIPTAAKLQQASPQVLMDSDADAGTFTLEVTGSDGIARKTGDLAWNISASQLQVAMNGLALSGVLVNVEGSGTAEDPWSIDGVKPSQIAIDSAKLLKGTKSTNMQMTSARQVQFYNGQSMDDATGHQFPITGSDRDNGTLTIMLPDNAPILSADSTPLIGDGINAPVVTFEAIPVNTLEIFSIATSGTFTLSYTDASGIEHTSSDLAFDAAASQIAAAIFAITGDSVSVTGRGRISSPWMVTGLTVEQITSESKMKNPLGDPTELIGQISDGAGYRIWVEHAQGGTFTLTLDNTLEHVTTEPISFNASTSDLFTALRALPGITAQVTGAGTSDDPWIVQTGALPIRIGDPLVFRDSWGMPGLGMIDGRTYYAIVLEKSDDPREITLQLTATLEGAEGGSSDWGDIATNQHIEMRPYLPLVPASAPGLNGKSVTLYGTSGQVPDGITITAGLDSSNSIGSYANLGGFPLLSYALGVNQLGSKIIISKSKNTDGTDSWIENLIKNRIPEGMDISNQWEVVGAAALQWIDNKVEVAVGRTAEVGTDGTLTIHSDINQTLSTVSNAGLSKTNSNNENWAVAVAFAFSNVSNTSKAIVSSKAIVTGGYGVDIDSKVSYVPPAHWPLIRQVGQLFRKDQEFWKHILSEMETLFSDIFLGDLGLLTANFNTVANVGIARIGGAEKNQEEVMKFVGTGSFAYEIIHNDNLAQIADGAKVNVPNQQFTTYSMVTNSEEEKSTSPQSKWLADNGTQTVGFNRDSNFGPDARIRLRYDTELTEWIRPDASASEVQSALENLKLIGVGNVSVSADPSRPYEWKIQFLNKAEDFTRRQIAIQTKNIDNPKLFTTDEENNTPTHGVSVVAETNAKQWGLGGQLYFSLPYIIHGLVSGDGNGFAKSWREGGPFRSAAKNAFGGSVSLLTMDGSTQALLGGYDTYYDPKDASTKPDPQSTEVYYGTGYEGGLRISANTRNGVVQVAQASANSSGFGFEGSVAYVTMGEPHSDVNSDDRRQKTYAKMIASTVPLEVSPISKESDGGISVNANDQSFGWAITGSLLIGQSKGIGLSGSVIELTRDVQASIGSQLASIDPYLPANAGNLASAVAGSQISTNGSIDVQSTLSGTFVPLALVGEFSVRSSEARNAVADQNGGNVGNADGSQPPIPAAQGDGFFTRIGNKFKKVGDDLKKSWDAENKWITSSGKEGNFGFFISGDFSGAFVEDQAYSYVDASGNLTGANAANSKLDVSSGDSTTINPGAGAFALQFSKESTSNKTGGFAGSVAWADVNSNVQAWVQSSSLDQLGLNVSATNGKHVGSGAAGLQIDSPTGFDLQVMGSVVINTIDNTTKAWIDQTNQTNAGDISVSALQDDEIFGLAGTAQLSIAPFRGKTVVGFGMSAAWSEINNTTDASIQRSTISQTQGNTLVSANDLTESEARSFGAQVAVTAGNVIEIGGMWTANLLFPNTSSTISDSQIYSTSDPNEAPKFTATAWLNPWMVSFAGYFSLGVSTGEKDVGQLGVGVASVTARIGSRDDDNGDVPAEYATSAKITNSTITGFSDVGLYSLTGEQSDQTTGFFGDSQGPGSTGDEARWNIHSLAIAGGLQAGAAPLTIAGQGASVATRQHVDTISTIVNSQIRNPGEVQRIGYETSDKLTDGTFTLEFNGQTTDPIPVNADAATVQAALENLPKIGAGNIAVTKDQDSDKAQSWIITFQNALGHSNQPSITINTGSLLPETSTRKTIRETLFAYRGDEPNVDVLSFNQLTVHTDAGGVAASLSFGESGNAIAAGFALNLYHSQSETVASIDDSKIDAASATISALLKPYIENYAFGVAVSAGTNLALGGSGADLILTQQDSAQAWISRDSVITTTGDLSVNATDESFLRTWAGSGSLAGAGEIGGVAAGGVGNFITVRNNVLAYLGSRPNTDRSDDKPDLNNYGIYNPGATAVSVGGALSVESIVGQTIKNFAFAVAVAGGSELGLAGSGASSKIFLANIALATINSATVTMSGSGTMTVLAKTLGKDPDYDGKSDPDISDRTYEVYAHVGDVAATAGSYGGSIGVSLGLITNDDLISAQVQGSTITTGGGEVTIDATDHRNLVSNVWVTSIAIALGAAGAGGHSFIYSQPNVIAELGNGTSVLSSDDQTRSDLSVQATGQESIHARIVGGVGGLIAIGDMISEADKHGTIWAGVGTTAAMTTDKLNVKAIGNHDIDAHGLSYGAGGITISGDGHRLTYDELIFSTVGANLQFKPEDTNLIATPVSGGSSTINSYGDVTLSSTSSTQAYASGDGRGDGGNTHSGSWGAIALGFFHSSAIYSPTIKTQSSDVTINYGGSVAVQSGIARGMSQSRAMTASGSVIGGDQTKAENTIAPEVDIVICNFVLKAMDTDAHHVSFSATVDMQFDTYADSLALTFFGGGAGARVVNTFSPSTTISVDGNNSLKGNGDVSLISHTAMTRIPNADDEIFGHYNDEHLQNSSRGGGGGLVAVDAATIETTYNGTAEIVFSSGSNTSIVPQDSSNKQGKANKSPANHISILALHQIDIQDLASQDTGGLAGGASAKNTLGLTLSTNILSDDSEVILNLDAGQGTITVATAIDVDTYTKTVARNGGLIAASSSEAKVTVNSTETIRIGSGTTVTGNEVTVSTGTDSGQWGINDFAPGINAVSSAASKSDVSGNDPLSDVEIAQSNSILSNAKVVGISSVTFNQGYESTDGCIAMKYGSQKFFGDSNWNHEWDAGSVSVDIDQQAVLSVNNSIYAGYETFEIEADTAGLSVNGLNYSWQTPDPSNPANYKLISPESIEPSTNFTPFLSLASPSIDTALSLVMDKSSLNTFKANYQASSSNSAIAYTLKDLFVPQGNIQLIADRIAGSAAVKAYVPKLNIVNQTDNWLILDGISSYTNPNSGKITLRDRQGNPISAPSLNIVSNEGSERTINVSVSQDNGNSTPFMIIAGYLNSPSSEVTLTNNYGPIIELAPIHAASVTINVPNSAFAVYTPGAYFGTGGNSQLAFEDAINANALNPASGVNTSSTNPFLPGLTVTGTGTKYDANYVASAASDYINGTSTSRIPIYSSGSSSVIASHLGSGINAAQIAVFAKTIDINAPLTIGRKEEISVVLSENLGETLRQHQADYKSGLQSDPLYTIPIGDNSVRGFDEFVPANTSYSTAITASQMILTDGSMNVARAGWHKNPVPINDDFTISFTYQASGNKRADGIALVLQNQGTSVVGNDGGGLGYVGIPGSTAAYQINLYGTSGSNFVTTNSSGTYQNTGPVDFRSGHRIRVTLAYDAARQQVIEQLTDLDNSDSSKNSHTSTYSGINLSQIGRTAYIGFTGASGSLTSVQAVSDFSMVPHQIVNGVAPLVSAIYDARTNEITLSSIALTERIRVVLDGEIISTIGGSRVSLIGGLSGQGIQNYTGIPLVLNNIDSGPGGASGTVEFRDTPTQTNTRYIFNSSGLSVYTAPRGHNYNATPDNVSLSQSVDFQPQQDLLYVSSQRQEIFKVASLSSVFSSGNSGWYPATPWNYGDVSTTGFGAFQTVNAASIDSNQNQLTLTTSGTESAANAAWLQQPIDVTRSFLVSYRYDGSGDGDGVAFALQAAGTGVVGEDGGELGYSGIAGNKAAFMINLYDYKNGPHPGVNFDFNENWGKSYDPISPIAFSSPIEVQLYYDANQKKWFAFLADGNGNEYTKSFEIDLSNTFGSNRVYAGFTGSTGLKSSTQSVKNFLLVYDPQTVPTIAHLESDLVHVVKPQLIGFTGFGPAGYLTADSISADTITFANYDNFSNRQRAAWYGEKLSTDFDTLSVDFTYQASFQNPKIEGFGDFVPQSNSYSRAITPDKITLTNGSQSVARAAWLSSEIGTKDDFEIKFKYQTDGKAVQGFSNFVAPTTTPNAASITSTQITLTDGTTGIARAAWNNEQVPLNYGFTIDFTYQASGDRNADGVALVFQTQGTNAVGSPGGGLGYVGIAGNKAAYQINIFGGNSQTKGSNFVSDDTSGTYNYTQGFAGIGGVDFSNGNRIHVRLTYDPISHQISESLTDLDNNNTYNHTYSNINLASVLGTSQAFIGFTGSSGGKTSVQTVKDFSFQSNQADGIALVFQKQGTGAIGNGGGDLGYVGIPGATAAYQINLFADSSHTRGSSFVTSNTSGTYNSTGSVNFASGHPIQVRLSYNSHARELTEELSDLISNTTYTKTYSNVDLAGLLGSSAFVGFTGGSGTLTAVQSVQDFSLESFPDDGIALVFQSAGSQVSGSAEEGLGYVGISGPTAAYQINLKSNGLQGSNFVTTNTAGTYLNTGTVDFAGRNPIRVQLNYNSVLRQMTEILTDTVTGETFIRAYKNIDLASVLGPTTYIGFTAPQGGSQRMQSVKDFSFAGTSTENIGFRQRFAAQPLSKSSDTSTTSYATDFNTWLRADNPVHVDFSGLFSDGLNVMSNASLTLNGLIRVSDIVTLTTTSGAITSTSSGSISARVVGLKANGDDGIIGNSNRPVNVNLVDTVNGAGYLSANASDGIYIASSSDLTIGYVSTYPPTDQCDSPVVISTSGNILALAPPQQPNAGIYAGSLTLKSGGVIGSASQPLQVQLVPHTLDNGSTVSGLLNAQAAGDIELVMLGDVRVGRLSTPQTVSITTAPVKDSTGNVISQGNIFDGLTLDALKTNHPNLSPQMRKNIYEFLFTPFPDNSDQSIASLQRSIDSAYLQYWQLIPVTNFPIQPPAWNNWDPGDWGDIVTVTDSEGNPQQIYQLTAAGIDAFRPQVALVYQQENPSDSDVQDYANRIWQQCVATFSSTDAFGPDWVNQPPFLQFDTSFSFQASDETKAKIKASYQESFDIFTYLSTQALAHPSATTAISKVANIQAGNLILSSSGSIGEDRAAVDIPLEHFQNKTLTAEELQLVRFASQAGELQLIGTNTAGETIYYDAGSPPDSITLTGVRVKISRLLLVQLAATGSLSATSNSELLVASTSGDLNVKSANSTSNGFVWLDSAANLLVADGSTGTTVTGGIMRLDAGQAIGSSTLPLLISASGKVDVSSLGDASIKSASALNVGQWDVGGNLVLQSNGTGAITDAFASQRSSFAGFNTNGSGWTTAASPSSPTNGPSVQGFSNFVPKDSTYASAITSSQIQLTNGTTSVTRAAWLTNQIPTNNNFTIQFTYQASGSRQADGVALVFQTQGTNAVGNGGGGLGYVGIAGNKAAYQINIYNGHTIGSNFVTADTSGTYSTTGSVFFTSGHQIQVTLTYDVQKNTITETLKDLSTNATYTKTYSNINLASVLGASQAYIGFTGASGGVTAIQTVSNFTAQFSEPATGASVASSNSDDQLTITLPSATSSTETWPSHVAFAKNDLVQLSDHFTFGFVYQSSAIGSRLALDLGRDDQAGLALVLNLGNADGSGAWADFVNSSEIETTTSGQSLGSVRLNSNNPIQVTFTYSLLTQTAIATLTDTVTKNAVSIQQSVNLIQRLGGRSASVAFKALGSGVALSTHAIHGFRFIDGAVNLSANSLNVIAGGAFGSLAAGSVPAQPILMLIDGKTQISAGAAIVAQQVLGDLETGSIVSPTTINLSAPFGSVVQYVPPSGSGSGGEGDSVTLGLVAPSVELDSLLGIGSSIRRVMVTTSTLSARTAMNDLLLYHQGPEDQSQSTVTHLSAGGTVDLISDSHLSVTGPVVGSQARFHSILAGNAVRLSLAQLSHIFGGPLDVSISGYSKLEIDHSQATEDHELSIAQNRISAHSASILLGMVQSLGLSLGNGSDQVRVHDASGLSSLEIRGSGGDDQISIANAALAIKQMLIGSGLGEDILDIDLLNTGAWVTKTSVETAFGRIDLVGISQLNLNRLETSLDPGAVDKIQRVLADFPADRLLIVGTTGPDSLSLTSLASELRFSNFWNSVTMEEKIYKRSAINDVEMYLLGGDDSLLVNGSAGFQLDIHGGRGNDRFLVQDVGVSITDLYGNNRVKTAGGADRIHTGAGDDQINAAGGENQIWDDGGMNYIFSGDQNDVIRHSNVSDRISAGGGTNSIYLNGQLRRWQNQNQPMDVNRDGYASPLDALMVIDRINRFGMGSMNGSADSTVGFYDVDGDGSLTPLDALVVIDWLNKRISGEGENSLHDVANFDTASDLSQDLSATKKPIKKSDGPMSVNLGSNKRRSYEDYYDAVFASLDKDDFE